jgi:hypothetical protein
MAKARKRTESASVIDNHAPSSDAAPSRVEPDTDDPRDRIALRAYELFLERGGADGGDFDDWLAAEREIAVRGGSAPPGDSGE